MWTTPLSVPPLFVVAAVVAVVVDVVAVVVAVVVDVVVDVVGLLTHCGTGTKYVVTSISFFV